MTDPLSFPSSTPRHGLPLLFAGQAQKEMTVNAAHAIADALLHPAVGGTVVAPPANAADGECWLVASDAIEAFAGHDGELACRQAGTWVFAHAHDGMRVFDLSSGQHVLFAGGWRRVDAPVLPVGGATIDTESRTAIAAIVAALRETGILAQSGGN
jgi:hypothetical protein